MTDSDTKLVDGTMFPAHEVHMIEWMKQRNERVDGHLTYQYHKLVAALKYTRGWRTAIDIGGHIGMWSRHLVRRFDHVVAIEPVAVHRRCFAHNVPPGNYTLLPFALGEDDGRTVYMQSEVGSSGNTTVGGEAGDPVTMHRLDALVSSGQIPKEVDFIKLDCEGYELFALRGGESLLRLCRPAIIVEQKPGKAQGFALGERDAVAYLKSLGAKLRQEIAGDFIMSWDE